jgi:flagellar basal body-associated protein FliL
MDSKWEKIHANSFKKEIVVINVSVVVGIVLIVMAGVCFWRYRKNKKLKSD